MTPVPVQRVAVVGHGVVGQRVTKRLDVGNGAPRIVHIDTRDSDPVRSYRFEGVHIAVLTQPGPHHATACALLDRGIHVVSIGDQVDDVEKMRTEGGRAGEHGCTLVVGAGMSPGLTGLIARHLASDFGSVDEIHVAVHGTAGPACARQHHHALAGTSLAYFDGRFQTARAGSGRELNWFPEPVGPYDCYRAELPSPILLHEVFPDADRITARMSANRRDRFTSRLPMLARPHSEGGVGAVRVEVRGADSTGARHTMVAGIAEMVGTASAATVVAYVEMVRSGRLRSGLVLPGDVGVDTTQLLRLVERFGVRLQEFTGVASA